MVNFFTVEGENKQENKEKDPPATNVLDDIELQPLSSDGIEKTDRGSDEELSVENTLEAELTSLKTENRRLNIEVADLQHERDELETSNCEFKEQTKKEIHNIKTEKEQAQKDIKNLRKEHAKAMEAFEKKGKNLRAEKEEALKEIDKLKIENSKTIEALRTEIVDLNKEKLRLNNEVTNLKAELEILKEKVEENSQ